MSAIPICQALVTALFLSSPSPLVNPEPENALFAVTPRIEVTAPTQGQVFTATVHITNPPPPAPASASVHANVSFSAKATMEFTGSSNKTYYVLAAFHLSAKVHEGTGPNVFDGSGLFPQQTPTPGNALNFTPVTTDTAGKWSRQVDFSVADPARLMPSVYIAFASITQSVWDDLYDPIIRGTKEWYSHNGFKVNPPPPHPALEANAPPSVSRSTEPSEYDPRFL
jgi:hypothetical protein